MKLVLPALPSIWPPIIVDTVEIWNELVESEGKWNASFLEAHQKIAMQYLHLSFSQNTSFTV